jgi:hypothetical protein
MKRKSQLFEDVEWHRLTQQFRCKQRTCKIPLPGVLEKRANVFMAARLGHIEYGVTNGYSWWRIGHTKVTTEVNWLVKNGDLRVTTRGAKVVLVDRT